VKGEGIDFSVSIEFEVGESALDLGPMIEVEKEAEDFEKQLKSGQLGIVVKSSSTRMELRRIYTDMKDYRQKNIGLDIVSEEFYKGKQIVLDILIYYERTGLNNGQNDHSFILKNGYPAGTRAIKDGGPTGVFSSGGNDSYYGSLRLIIEKNVESVQIPLQMKTKQKSNVYNVFDINININIEEESEGNNKGDFTDVLIDTDYYKPTGGSNAGVAELEMKIGTVLSVITNLGMILSVLISAILGVKYMLASVEEKAEIKSDMIPYLIGACLVFGVCTVVKILQSVGYSFN